MPLEKSLLLHKGALPYSMNLLRVPMGDTATFLNHIFSQSSLELSRPGACKLSPHGTGPHPSQSTETQLWPLGGTPGCPRFPSGVGSGLTLGMRMGPPSQPIALNQPQPPPAFSF